MTAMRQRAVREGTFFCWEGGGGSEGRVLLVSCLQIGEGQTCFILNRGRGHSFFGKEKIYTPCRFYFVYTSKATSQD